MIPYGRQHIDEDDVAAVIRVLKSDYLTQGPRVGEFETELARYCGCDHAVVFNSGTSALHAAYFAAGLTNGDEFITSPITFVATSNAGLYLGAVPVFADIEPDTGNIDPAAATEKITERTKLIVPVHYAGHSAAMAELADIAQEHDLRIIEDACHALGGTYRDQRVGCCRFSHLAVLSFHPIKNITTGEGGAVLTNDRVFHEKLLLFRAHGITKDCFANEPDGDWYYEMKFLGYNYRMNDIQAALGLSQLKKLDGFTARRREIGAMYDTIFAGNPYFHLPAKQDDVLSAFHLYPIRLKDAFIDRKKVIFSQLRTRGLGVQVHYIPAYLHPFYHDRGYRPGLCPRAERFYCQEISLPLFPSMTSEMVRIVVETVQEVFDGI